MAADGRLRQLHHGAQLRNGQLLTIQQQDDAAARGVRKGRQVIVNCERASIHP